MKRQTVERIFDDYSKNPYVEGTVLMSKVGVPIAGNRPKNVPVQSFLSLASVTYEGASELADVAGQKFKEMDVELSNGSRIIIKVLQESYLLAVQVQKYDDKVREDIESLSDQICEYISNFYE